MTHQTKELQDLLEWTNKAINLFDRAIEEAGDSDIDRLMFNSGAKAAMEQSRKQIKAKLAELEEG